jgi:putative transposase
MPRGKLGPTLEEVKALLAEDQDFLRPLVQAVLQELLAAEMTEAPGARKGERTPARLGYRAGYYGRTLVTRVGKLELRVPPGSPRPVLDRAVRALSALGEGAGGGAGRDVRAGRLNPEGQGDHRAPGSRAPTSVVGAERRAVRAQLLGRGDQRHQRQARRGAGRVCAAPARRGLSVSDRRRASRARARGRGDPQPAVLLAIAIGWDGRRSILAVELANRESRSSWRDFLRQAPRARLVGGRVRGLGRPYRAQTGDRRGAAGGRPAALLRAFPAQRARLRAT